MDFDKFVLKAAKMITRGVWTDEEAKAACAYESPDQDSYDEMWEAVQVKVLELSSQ